MAVQCSTTYYGSKVLQEPNWQLALQQVSAVLQLFNPSPHLNLRLERLLMLQHCRRLLVLVYCQCLLTCCWRSPDDDAQWCQAPHLQQLLQHQGQVTQQAARAAAQQLTRLRQAAGSKGKVYQQQRTWRRLKQHSISRQCPASTHNAYTHQLFCMLCVVGTLAAAGLLNHWPEV
jgi:hypothetical protein